MKISQLIGVRCYSSLVEDVAGCQGSIFEDVAGCQGSIFEDVAGCQGSIFEDVVAHLLKLSLLFS
jgi:hypothetical protein